MDFRTNMMNLGPLQSEPQCLRNITPDCLLLVWLVPPVQFRVELPQFSGGERLVRGASDGSVNPKLSCMPL
jgi:hypothetical protein